MPMNEKISERCDFYVPSQDEFRRGYEVYNEKERRGLVYFEALETVQANWGDAGLMARGVRRLIRSWNRFYANFSLSDLTLFLEENFKPLNTFKNRHIVGDRRSLHPPTLPRTSPSP